MKSILLLKSRERIYVSDVLDKMAHALYPDGVELVSRKYYRVSEDGVKIPLKDDEPYMMRYLWKEKSERLIRELFKSGELKLICPFWKVVIPFGDVNNHEPLDCLISFSELERFADMYDLRVDVESDSSSEKIEAPAVENKGKDTRTNQLHALIWRARQYVYSSGTGSAQKVWNEIQHRHKQHDTDEIIQEVTAIEILWRSGYGNEPSFKRSSLDSLLSRLKKSPPF